MDSIKKNKESSFKKQTLTKNKFKIYILAALLASTGLEGCRTKKIEYSDPRQTSGIVIKKEHIKEHYLNPIDNINPMRNIDPTFDLKNHRSITKTKEAFKIYIKTESDIIIKNNKELFNQLSENDKVDVTYREVYEEFFDDQDKDGKEELVEKNKLKNEILDIKPQIKNQ